jgi:hypothetical protein
MRQRAGVEGAVEDVAARVRVRVPGVIVDGDVLGVMRRRERGPGAGGRRHLIEAKVTGPTRVDDQQRRIPLGREARSTRIAGPPLSRALRSSLTESWATIAPADIVDRDGLRGRADPGRRQYDAGCPAGSWAGRAAPATWGPATAAGRREGGGCAEAADRWRQDLHRAIRGCRRGRCVAIRDHGRRGCRPRVASYGDGRAVREFGGPGHDTP